MNLADLLPRLGIDLFAVVALAYGLYYRRHGRRELLVLYGLFNVGLFLALVVIAAGSVTAGIGFGLFAVLSIIRLRSEPFTHTELAYFFIALILALVSGVDLGDHHVTAALSAVALVAAALVDHPRLLAGNRRVELVLELVFGDELALRRHVEERLDARIVELEIREVDFVREVTRVSVTLTPRAPAAPSPARREESHAHVRDADA